MTQAFESLISTSGTVLEPEKENFLTSTRSDQISLRRCFQVELRSGEDKWVVAQCKELPAAVTQGKTKDEAVRNVIEAITLVLEEMGENNPEFSVITFETRH